MAGLEAPAAGRRSWSDVERTRLLQRVQPALNGLIDGSLSSLAPIFAVVMSTHRPVYAFGAGLATAIRAGISRAFSEGRCDTGEATDRGRPGTRGMIVGGGTFAGGIVHTLPFLVPAYPLALLLAVAVVACELVMLAWLRHRFFVLGFGSSLLTVTAGGLLIVAVSAGLGALVGNAAGG